MTTPARISMIWAQALDRIIGRDGEMPWHLPEDFAHFKSKTVGAPVIMGRTTWESLPAKSRPLPGRTNIVLTRNPAFSATGAVVVGSTKQAIAAAQEAAGTSGSSRIWIIGGANVYEQFMPYAQTLEITDINLEVVGDTRAPSVPADFIVEHREPAEGWLTSRTELEYAFTRYEREGDTASTGE